MTALRIVDPFPPVHGQREPGLMWRYPPGDVPGREYVPDGPDGAACAVCGLAMGYFRHG